MNPAIDDLNSVSHLEPHLSASSSLLVNNVKLPSIQMQEVLRTSRIHREVTSMILNAQTRRSAHSCLHLLTPAADMSGISTPPLKNSRTCDFLPCSLVIMVISFTPISPFSSRKSSPMHEAYLLWRDSDSVQPNRISFLRGFLLFPPCLNLTLQTTHSYDPRETPVLSS